MEHTSITWPEICEGGAAMRLGNALCRTYRSSWTRKSQAESLGDAAHANDSRGSRAFVELYCCSCANQRVTQHTTMSPANFKCSQSAMNAINSVVGNKTDEIPEKVAPILVWLQFFSIRQPLVVPFDAQQDESIFLISAT